MVHEASLHERNSFVTLTYSDDSLPPRCSLDKRAFPKFIKRLRKHLNKKNHPRSNTSVRYYHCGEYGDLTGRPHYHACLFGQNFDHDRELFKLTNGNRLYTSPELSHLWPYGHAVIAELTFETAAYVARYAMKKINNPIESDYTYLDLHTGDLVKREPEYATMSRRPGIGANWIEKFSDDTYKDDSVIINGKQTRPPKFYDGLLEKRDPQKYEAIKTERIRLAQKYQHDNTPRRLAEKEKCLEAKQNQQQRNQC